MNTSAKQEIALPPKGGPVPVAVQQAAAVTPMDMLDRAVQQGANIDVMEKLMGLQERWEANQARKAFDAAIALAKAEIPPIFKNRKVGYDSKKTGDRTSYRHEDLAEIARTIDPILSKHGLSYRHRTNTAPGQPITVTCIVSHRDGHSEENSLPGPADTTGSKNALQAIGSTVTYLQRYTLKAALGLSASDDDDARSAGEPETASTITYDQAEALAKIIEDSGADPVKFCKAFGIERVHDLAARDHADAVAKLKTFAARAKK